jgi:amidohydrolase
VVVEGRSAGVDPTLLDDARRLQSHMVEVRREIHRHPELGLELPRTQGLVMEALGGLGLELTTGERTTSVVAVLEGGRPGPATLLRGDMDALPLVEDTGLSFSSEVEGAMHACGHDAHVAMLLGAAEILAARREEVAGRVVFMFQPGEEGAGGAKVMLEEGLLERHGPVDRAFAIHITPMVPSGWIATRGGTLMASADEFRITVSGKGGHASMPHDAVDPVPVACEMVTALQSMVTRRLPVFDPAVLTVARIVSGTTTNVIPETAVLEGTVRAVSDASRELVLEGLRRVAAGVAAAHLCRAQVEMTGVGYPVTVNDQRSADEALGVAGDLLGADRVVAAPTPVMGAEDWSFVLQRVAGSMVFLGAAPPGVDHPAPSHSNRMVIDEPAMAVGVALHAAMALTERPMEVRGVR